MTDKTARYEVLLEQFSSNMDIYDLIEECILDDLGKREAEYIRNGKYPEQRNLLMKLKSDLLLKFYKVTKENK